MSRRLGSAQWIEPQSVADDFRFENGQFWLGRAVTQSQTPVGFQDDRHICLVSGNRGGKGTTTIIPNLCLYPGSVVVVDPKGENASVTAARRGTGSEYCKGMGQAVHVLDPFEAAQVGEGLRSRFNPLDALDPEDDEVIDEAGRIADALVVMQDKKDPFWDESAREMIKGLILHVLTDPHFEGKRNLVTLRKLLMRGDWIGLEKLKALEVEDLPTGHELLWQRMADNHACREVIAGIGASVRNQSENAPKQFESVLQVAKTNTEFLDSPAMQRVLAASDFKLSDLKTDETGVSLYLSLPQRYMRTHYRWLRMMISLIITEMEVVPGQPASGHPVLMCLDEFAGLKRMEVIENAVAQIAGFGVKLFFVLQSLEQLKATYKDRWETFLANAGLKIFFSLEDHFSREYVSKLIGETELIRESRSSSTTEGESKSQTRGESRTTTKTRSRSKTRSSSKTSGTSRGSNASRTTSRGGSEGRSWKPEFFFFRTDKRENDGRSWSNGQSFGSSSGSSRSSTNGSSSTIGTSRAEGYTESFSETTTTSSSATDGRSETFHKRALITPDEIGQLFSRIKDPDHPGYPGMGLVVISGLQPLAVRRTNYYEDPRFGGLFDPHPDYKSDSAQIAEKIKILMPERDLLRYISGDSHTRYREKLLPSYDLHIEKGSFIFEDDPIVTYTDLQDTGSHNLHGSDDITIKAPVSGEVVHIDKASGYIDAIEIKTYDAWRPSKHRSEKAQRHYQGDKRRRYHVVQYAYDYYTYLLEDKIRIVAIPALLWIVAGFACLMLVWEAPTGWFINLIATLFYAGGLAHFVGEFRLYRDEVKGFDKLQLPQGDET